MFLKQMVFVVLFGSFFVGCNASKQAPGGPLSSASKWSSASLTRKAGDSGSKLPSDMTRPRSLSTSSTSSSDSSLSSVSSVSSTATQVPLPMQVAGASVPVKGGTFGGQLKALLGSPVAPAIRDRAFDIWQNGRLVYSPVDGEYLLARFGDHYAYVKSVLAAKAKEGKFYVIYGFDDNKVPKRLKTAKLKVFPEHPMSIDVILNFLAVDDPLLFEQVNNATVFTFGIGAPDNPEDLASEYDDLTKDITHQNKKLKPTPEDEAFDYRTEKLQKASGKNNPVQWAPDETWIYPDDEGVIQ